MKYRLPTDAEWSAAVGGDKYPWGSQWPPPTGAGNYFGQEVQLKKWRMIENYFDGAPRTAEVGRYTANRLGLYDLGGNVSEWCDDYYRKEMNSAEVRKEFPVWENDGGGSASRVLRGGSWNCVRPSFLLSAFRFGGAPAGVRL